MKLKELHIRNIASIERADINFETDLNDKYTGEKSPIFIITGDTGTGKSAIIDCISMALFKTTPRLKGVENANKNEYVDSDGETVRVATLQQYTRLGIKPGTECYSEVVFEGNDCLTYHARLKLGRFLGNTDKKTGRRPLKYSTPDWEVKVGNGDWTKDGVKNTLRNAVGLDFEQFCRMAMLAQGQFSTFLVGDKSQREDILEKLTNTQIFSDYGVAIENIYKRYKDDRDKAEHDCKAAQGNLLPPDEVECIKQESLDLQRTKVEIEGKVKAVDDIIRQVEVVVGNEQARDKAQSELESLKLEIVSDVFKRKQALITDWDNTTDQRQTLAKLVDARQRHVDASNKLNNLKTTFMALSADIAYRKLNREALARDFAATQAWLDNRKQLAEVFDHAGETIAKMGQWKETKALVGKNETSLEDEKAKTAGLLGKRTKASEVAKQAEVDVMTKQAEIDDLTRQREELKPKEIDESINKVKAELGRLEGLLSQVENLQKKKAEAARLEKEINDDNASLDRLKKESDDADADYQSKKDAADSAASRLTTMKMSVDEKIVELRRRIHDEHTETCPLCGQRIDHEVLGVNFHEIITPLAEEQKRAAEALAIATVRREKALGEYNEFKGKLLTKNEQLKRDQQQIDTESKAIDTKAAEARLDTAQPLVDQIEPLIEKCEKSLEELNEKQKKASAIQDMINRKVGEKGQLTKVQSEAAIALTKADNEVKNNTTAIGRLKQELDDSRLNLKCIDNEISLSLYAYAQQWKADVDATLAQLRDDARTYDNQKKKLGDEQNRLAKADNLIRTIENQRNGILDDCTEWSVEQEPKAYNSDDVAAEWTHLLSDVKGVVSNLRDYNTTIGLCTEQLDAYYAETGKNEPALTELSSKEREVARSRQDVNDALAKLKSRNDAIVEAQRLIDNAMRALNITDRNDLPDKPTLEEEKASLLEKRDGCVSKISENETKLKQQSESEDRLTELRQKLAAATATFNRWDNLNKIFGGTRFRTIVQSYILRPLLNNANIYLQKITDRYCLACSDTNEQLSILVLDRYNKDAVRSATVLSGGERFMISLALSLALSSLNRPSLNVDILFIDEGFGTLDQKCLGSVMATLEKLQEIAGQTNRRVGVISHVADLAESIPTKIKVVKRGEGRSIVEIENG